MNPISHIQTAFASYLQNNFAINSDITDKCSFLLNTDPNRQEFGALNSHAALVLAKSIESGDPSLKNPRALAQKISQEFKHPYIEKIEIAGPGFINVFLTAKAFIDLANELYTRKDEFFKLQADRACHRYNIEFVSANPTGPLHLGHGRGAIIGDVYANILRFLGHSVTKEFYVNDAGNQMYKLGSSLKIRCQQIIGINEPLPEDGYQGEYLIDLAQQCIKECGNDIVNEPISFFESYGKEHLLAAIQQTLRDYGVTFDVWFSEKTLHESGNIQHAIAFLQEHKYIYEHEGALWFTSTQFGDDKDRVVKKNTGEWTYVAADIAYLLNKAKRGFDHLVMVLGHDHHSYAVRLQGIRQALGLSRIDLAIILYQLVTMKASGQLLQMSKRAGTMITLRDIIDKVGKDVARFFYLNRKADAQLEFDIDLALKKTEENPVYYVQYAYVRTGSILQKAAQVQDFASITHEDLHGLSPAEHLLIAKIASLQHTLLLIAQSHQTHQLAHFTIELADLFHRYYAQHKVIDASQVQKSRARLALIVILRNTFATTFALLGISAPEKM